MEMLSEVGITIITLLRIYLKVENKIQSFFLEWNIYMNPCHKIELFTIDAVETSSSVNINDLINDAQHF